ncbi:cell division protein ZapA [Thermaurantiacus sp.]
MADLLVSIAGRAYRLACRDGEEESLKAAARLFDSKAIELQQALGAITEPRLLLMAGLMIAGEYLERDDPQPPASAPGEGMAHDPARLEALVGRVEALAERLEHAARSATGLEEPPASA